MGRDSRRPGNWFEDESADPQMAARAFAILEKHFPEAEADYRHGKKGLTRWPHVRWHIGFSIRVRLDPKNKGRLRPLLAELADFCAGAEPWSRLLFELYEDGQLPPLVSKRLPLTPDGPLVLKKLAELQNDANLREEQTRRMDQMGY